MNRSAEQTNRSRTASRFTRFVCPALRFIPREPRKKDTHSLKRRRLGANKEIDTNDVTMSLSYSNDVMSKAPFCHTLAQVQYFGSHYCSFLLNSLPEISILSIMIIKSDLNIKKRLILRCIHHFNTDLIDNIDHMRISVNEPSSVILGQTK